MDKEKVSQKLNEFFGDKTVKVFMPKQFLANLSTVLAKQNEALLEQIKKNNISPELLADNKKTQDLLIELKKAIQEKRVEKVKVENFPEYPKFPKFPEIKIPEQKEIKIPEYPTKINLLEPSWYEKIQNKLIEFLAEGFRMVKKSFASDLDRHKAAKNALAVRLVTYDGKDFYTAMFSGGGGGTVSRNVNIRDGGGTALTSTLVGTDQALDVNIVAGAGAGGTASTDDADFTAGATEGTPAMGVYESTPSNVTDGDLGVVGITQDRKLRVDGSEVTQPVNVVTPDLMLGTDFSDVFGTDSLRDDGSMNVAAKKKTIDECESTDGWAAQGEASNIQLSTEHTQGSYSISFDKSGTGGATGYIEKTISSINLTEFQTHAILHIHAYVSNAANISKLFVNSPIGQARRETELICPP